MNRSNCNVGKQIMILQEQLNHKKKMESIYNQSSRLPFTQNKANQYSYLHKRYSKKDYYEDKQHTKNIRRLYEVLSN